MSQAFNSLKAEGTQQRAVCGSIRVASCKGRLVIGSTCGGQICVIANEVAVAVSEARTFHVADEAFPVPFSHSVSHPATQLNVLTVSSGYK